MKKALLIILALFVFATTMPQTGYAASKARQEPSTSAIVFDVILARPLGIASIALGTGIFCVALPFSLFSGSTGDTAKKLIGEPIAYTFGRPVGQMD